MKKRLILPCLAALATGMLIQAEDLVILHTNDTHSHIESENGIGGILQRKALIDSVRKAEKNVILVDAGDMVQGTLYFKYFNGDVEYPLFNLMDYDIRILGNHEFDNGLESLARHYKDVKAERLSANYDFSDTPLKGMFKPYTIKKVDGKKIGFIGLNVDPESLIFKENTKGMKFLPIVETANRTAAFLKKEKGCDLVVAVTHIGYTTDTPDRETDVDLARESRDIDIIIGGHSHTVVPPGNDPATPCLIPNAEGRPVLVTQTGKYGKYLGYIKIDLDKLKGADGSDFDYELIPVTDRFPESKLDKKLIAEIAPFKHKVDSVNAHVIARSLYTLSGDDRNGGYANWTADFARDYGKRKLDSISGGTRSLDFAIMNVGGIRQSMPAGDVTEGQMLSTFPFTNYIVLMDVKGSDIIKAMEAAAFKGGEAISSEVRVVVDPEWKVKRVVVDGEPIDPDKTYTIATIDYLAQGNDHLTSLANGTVFWQDKEVMSAPLMRYVTHTTGLGLPIAPDTTGRFMQEVIIE